MNQQEAIKIYEDCKGDCDNCPLHVRHYIGDRSICSLLFRAEKKAKKVKEDAQEELAINAKRTQWKLEQILGIRRENMVNAIFEASIAHDKARQLPACRPERVEEVLWDWAENHDEMDIQKVQAELKYLYHEQEAEARRQQGISGNV